jgi:hypothetical protein
VFRARAKSLERNLAEPRETPQNKNLGNSTTKFDSRSPRLMPGIKTMTYLSKKYPRVF